MQTAIANFVKDPYNSPLPSWPMYQPSNDVPTLAKLAYSGNVGIDNVVEVVPSGSFDSVCTFWNAILTAPKP